MAQIILATRIFRQNEVFADQFAVARPQLRTGTNSVEFTQPWRERSTLSPRADKIQKDYARQLFSVCLCSRAPFADRPCRSCSQSQLACGVHADGSETCPNAHRSRPRFG